MNLRFTRFALAAGLLFACFAAQAYAQSPPSEYTFAVTKHNVIDPEYGNVSYLVNSAGDYLVALQGPRGVNIAIACVILGILAYLFEMRPAAYAFFAMAGFVVMINRPYLGLSVFLPILIYKQIKLRNSQLRMEIYNSGMDVLPESLKERKAQKKEAENAAANPPVETPPPPPTGSSTKIVRPI